MIDKHVLRASFTTLVVSSVCLSICLSIYVTCSIHAETQPGRIVARSGLFLSYLVKYLPFIGIGVVIGIIIENWESLGIILIHLPLLPLPLLLPLLLLLFSCGHATL